MSHTPRNTEDVFLSRNIFKSFCKLFKKHSLLSTYLSQSEVHEQSVDICINSLEAGDDRDNVSQLSPASKESIYIRVLLLYQL